VRTQQTQKVTKQPRTAKHQEQQNNNNKHVAL